MFAETKYRKSQQRRVKGCLPRIGHMTNVIQQKLSDTCYGLHTRTPRYPAVAHAARKSGVSHLLHTWWPSHLRALLSKRGNVDGEVLNRLRDLHIVLPGSSRPDPFVA